MRRLTEDDRFTRNRNDLEERYGSDVERMLSDLQLVRYRLDGEPEEMVGSHVDDAVWMLRFVLQQVELTEAGREKVLGRLETIAADVRRS